MPVNGYPVRTSVFVPYVALEEDPSFLHRSLPFPRAMLCLHPRCERYSSAAITRYTVCGCGRNLGKVLLHKPQRKATQGELFLKKTWRAGITKPKTLFFLHLLRLLALPPFLHVNSRSTEKTRRPHSLTGNQRAYLFSPVSVVRGKEDRRPPLPAIRCDSLFGLTTRGRRDEKRPDKTKATSVGLACSQAYEVLRILRTHTPADETCLAFAECSSAVQMPSLGL